MLRETGPRERRARALLLVGAWALASCVHTGKQGDTAGDANVGSEGDAASGSPSDDSGSVIAPGDAQGAVDRAPTQDGATMLDSAGVPTDAGATIDAAGTTDGGSANDGGVGSADGPTDGSSGPRDIGSCCAQQSTPGCSNPDLEICVCQKDKSCCTSAWGPACALLVQQKYCQANVRDCVCGTDAGQWGQTDCCNVDWTSTCDSVATLKCHAVQGCF